jgi:hypothetical protein
MRNHYKKQKQQCGCPCQIPYLPAETDQEEKAQPHLHPWKEARHCRDRALDTADIYPYISTPPQTKEGFPFDIAAV